jgi:DNA mismatch endonuclease, patch repair protein
MTDRLSTARRSAMMRRVRGKDTAPELLVRKLLHAQGYRYRLQGKELPGKPDIVFRRMKKAVFVHGCFWHGHGCKIGRLPKSRLEFWGPKIARNADRDKGSEIALRALGWDVLVVWQCETRDLAGLRERLVDFLGTPPHFRSTNQAEACRIRP